MTVSKFKIYNETDINPRVHAATGTLYSGGGCMHKVNMSVLVVT